MYGKLEGFPFSSFFSIGCYAAPYKARAKFFTFKKKQKHFGVGHHHHTIMTRILDKLKGALEGNPGSAVEGRWTDVYLSAWERERETERWEEQGISSVEEFSLFLPLMV